MDNIDDLYFDYLKAVRYNAISDNWKDSPLWVLQGKSGNYDPNSYYKSMMLYDADQQVVIAMSVIDYNKSISFIWKNSDYVATPDMDVVLKQHYAKYTLARSDKCIEVDVAQDLIEKLHAIVRGYDYDNLVTIPLEFTPEDYSVFIDALTRLNLSPQEFITMAVEALLEKSSHES